MVINIIDVFGWTASCILIILHFSPIPYYLKLCKGQIRFNDTPNLKVLGNYIMSINWLIYGYLLRNKHIFLSYLFGSFLSIICVFTFILFLAKVKLLKAFIFTLSLLLFTILSYFLFAILINNKEIIGYVCVILSFFLLLNPFLIIKKVIKYRNYKYIPIKVCTLNLIGSTCWIIYGFMIINFNLIIPNLIGLIVSLIMMFIWNIFKKRKPIVEDVANISINVTRSRPENNVSIV